jgi:hypothetical protein
VRGVRAVADEVGAHVLYDAAHMGGLIAGGRFQQPLQEGAHAITGSTYKSFGGPPSGMILTDDPVLAERLDAIAFPGLTANFDLARQAALALAALDLLEHERGCHDLGDGPEQETGVLAHRRPGGDVRHAVGDDRLLPGAVDTGDESGHPVASQKAATRSSMCAISFMPLILEPCPWGKVKRRPESDRLSRAHPRWRPRLPGTAATRSTEDQPLRRLPY